MTTNRASRRGVWMELGSLALLLLTAAAASDAADVPPTANRRRPAQEDLARRVDQVLASARCPREVQALVTNWGAAREWVGAPPDNDGGQNFLTPTQHFGVWLKITAYPDHNVEILRIAREARTYARWQQVNCQSQIKVETREADPSAAAKAWFTDEDLRTAMLKRSGFVYAWSPHMPLSVKGYPEAKALAGRRNWTFVPVLDPEADAASAEAVAHERNLGPEALRRYDSVELAARGMSLHYPNILPFRDGKIIGPIYPGYWEGIAQVEKIIEDRLSGSESP